MMILGPLGFTAPWLLLGLAALPVLWFLLRAVPPAPIRRRFPGVALLLGLTDDEQVADRTPWWLLALRMLAVAAAILAFAGPVLNPRAEGGGQGPLLVLTDGSWASARDWTQASARIEAALDQAAAAGRPAALVSLTDPPAGGPVFTAANDVAAGLPGLAPRAWEPSEAEMAAFVDSLPDGGFETLWLSDGLARPGRAQLLEVLMAEGPVTVRESPRLLRAIGPGEQADGALRVPVLRAGPGPAAEAEVAAVGLDPLGVLRELARGPVSFAAGEAQAEAVFDLPPELRNRVARFELVGEQTAGAVSLAGDTLRRREIALIDGGGASREGLELLAPTHYLEQALAPSADLIRGTLADILLADPDAIVMADVARITEGESAGLLDWIEGGGLLVRFAGPRLAASDEGRAAMDPLLPVRLRAGGRSVGGAMSWGEPKTLMPFPEGSPFHGLAVPPDVEVRAQVMAEPDPQLTERTIAALADGTPLVTARAEGAGQIVLFHVTANAEWSSLPLSGLFVQMLERLALASGGAQPEAADLDGTTWVADRVLDAFGALEDAGEMPGVPGARLADPVPGPDLPPGLYRSGDRSLAVNAIAPGRVLEPANWPAGVAIEGDAAPAEMRLQSPLLLIALALLMADILASLWLGGRLSRLRRVAALLVLGVVLGAGLPGMAPPAAAQEPPADSAADRLALRATSEVVLGHVATGDTQVDRVAEAGLRGLGLVLAARTSVEPGAPMAVNLDTDDLAVFSFLYWPVTPDQPAPSPEAYLKLNRFLRTGGLILFDTRDADVADFGAASPAGRRLQALAAPLDIPPIEPIPADHVLTRTFYLLQDFPGRYQGRGIWVEAAPQAEEQAEGMPFRNLNDGVTPVVIGGNDWASAWAVDDAGRPMYPVGRGMAGDRQREIAYRFGVNLIMHVLTGNYKSDQVHVPALLERLGQ
ncbi:DUF4159 domain-containing protein [Frigidibacter oleivorans]|uniref:DUF4159 domain-containing protein n=1 Tax=Frigidibacter oleivorans TaxID=2487129 RepID=UPI000F8F70F2|nr:DUF4159 domain-containing protein [Frigidibacter oleivorans]